MASAAWSEKGETPKEEVIPTAWHGLGIWDWDGWNGCFFGRFCDWGDLCDPSNPMLVHTTTSHRILAADERALCAVRLRAAVPGVRKDDPFIASLMSEMQTRRDPDSPRPQYSTAAVAVGHVHIGVLVLSSLPGLPAPMIRRPQTPPKGQEASFLTGAGNLDGIHTAGVELVVGERRFCRPDAICYCTCAWWQGDAQMADPPPFLLGRSQAPGSCVQHVRIHDAYVVFFFVFLTASSELQLAVYEHHPQQPPHTLPPPGRAPKTAGGVLPSLALLLDVHHTDRVQRGGGICTVVNQPRLVEAIITETSR
ncbi:hypothetical protein B0T10DRAFT_452995 [Thelonectria olida]|uniref:Uncharacterized protein n=1 Tax=Thelonectria olida TaxID=1576542 RepID=A0A9P8WID9_9HYPO|nr:hypothetical protein B0T10DRAFT_452995 [Thelonectria olida]